MEQITYQRIKKEHLSALANKLTEQEYHMLASQALLGMVAYLEEEPVGILLFTKATDGLFSLERIEVEEPYRRKGIGTDMMTLFCQKLHEARYELILSFGSVDEDTDFFQFLKSLRTFYIKQEDGFEAFLQEEEVSAICKTFATDKIIPRLFFEQNRNAKQEFINTLEKEYPQIAWELKYMPSTFRSDLCCCETDKNGNIQAICLFKEYEEDMELSFLYARMGNGALAAKALIGSINQFHSREHLPLRMSVVNESAAKILKHMSKHYEITKRGYTAYYLGE